MDIQGADPVNDEFEVGFDQRFEQSWSRAEQIGRVVMVLFVIAGLAGLLGRGPFSHERVQSAGSGLMVDFEPVARSQTGTQVTLHVANPGESPTVKIYIGSNAVEPMGLQRIIPQPVSTQTVQDGLTMVVAVPPGTQDAEIRLMLMPVSLGPNQLIAQVGGYDPIRWTQFVVP